MIRVDCTAPLRLLLLLAELDAAAEKRRASCCIVHDVFTREDSSGRLRLLVQANFALLLRPRQLRVMAYLYSLWLARRLYRRNGDLLLLRHVHVLLLLLGSDEPL